MPPRCHFILRFRHIFVNHLGKSTLFSTIFDSNKTNTNKLGSFSCFTHWGLNKMANILQKSFASEFSWMRGLEYNTEFYSNMFVRIWLMAELWLKWILTVHVPWLMWNPLCDIAIAQAVAWSGKIQWLRRNDYAMICWICGTKEREKTPLASILQKLGTEDITTVLRKWQFWWYGHVQHATSCIKSVSNFLIPSTRKQGRPRKTWSEWVKTNASNCGFDPEDRNAW